MAWYANIHIYAVLEHWHYLMWNFCCYMDIICFLYTLIIGRIAKFIVSINALILTFICLNDFKKISIFSYQIIRSPLCRYYIVHARVDAR